MIVAAILELVVIDMETAEKMAILLKEDIVESSDKGDVSFINNVIVPILHA